MNKTIKIVSGLLLLVGLAGGVAFYLSSGVANVANEFLSAAATGDIARAETYLSEEFKKTAPTEALQEFLNESSLVNYKNASWTNRNVTPDTAQLEGTVNTTSGAVIPLTLNFIKEGSAWKIHSIQKNPVGLEQAGEISVPNLEESAKLVMDTTLSFAKAVNEKDFAAFHSTFATEMQEQFPLADFTALFQEFITRELDLTPLGELVPMFKQDPAVTPNGILVLNGFFQSTPVHTHFHYEYVNRDNAWKLLGINVELKPIEGGNKEAPAEN